MEVVKNILIESMFISLLCMGWRIVISPGKLLGFVGNKLQRMYDHGGALAYISMPLGGCPYCMASFYGIFFHVCMDFIGLAVGWRLVPAGLLISCYLNGVFYWTLKKLDKGIW